MNNPVFSQEDTLRFSRHFPVIGLTGQQKLKQAKVLCVGAGGLASPALLYLTAAGVGSLGIIDDDQVELSNITRQILYEEADLGQAKVACASMRLSRLNSSTQIRPYLALLTENNARQLIGNYDVILDASDNFATRYLINKYCRLLAKPMVSASIHQFSGQLSVFNYQSGPCYECLYPQVEAQNVLANCAQAGVLGVVPGIVGSLQAAEVIKIILGNQGVLSKRLLYIDVLTMAFSQFEFARHPHCSKDACGEALQTKETERQFANNVNEITPLQLADWVTHKEQMYLIDVRQAYEREICHIGGDLIPLAELMQHLDQIPKDKKIVIYCKKGVRSQQAAQLLTQAGYKGVYTLVGGILNWIDQVQPELMKY